MWTQIACQVKHVTTLAVSTLAQLTTPVLLKHRALPRIISPPAVARQDLRGMHSENVLDVSKQFNYIIFSGVSLRLLWLIIV